MEDDQNNSCGTCRCMVGTKDEAMLCCLCGFWHHNRCENVNKELYRVLMKHNDDSIQWYCSKCKKVAGKILSYLTSIDNNQVKMEHKINELSCEVEQANKRVDNIRGEFEEKLLAMKRDTEKEMEEMKKEINMKTNIGDMDDVLQAIHNVSEKVKDMQKQTSNRMSYIEKEFENCASNTAALVQTTANELQCRQERKNNIVIYKVPELNSRNIDERIEHDKKFVLALFEKIGVLDYGSNFSVRRVGKPVQEATTSGVEKKKSRPMIVCLKEDMKGLIMKNLYKLKNVDDDRFNIIGITDDMTTEERKKDKQLREEAKEKNEAEKNSGNFYIVRGNPWDRYIKKVRRRVESVANK